MNITDNLSTLTDHLPDVSIPAVGVPTIELPDVDVAAIVPDRFRSRRFAVVRSRPKLTIGTILAIVGVVGLIWYLRRDDSSAGTTPGEDRLASVA